MISGPRLGTPKKYIRLDKDEGEVEVLSLVEQKVIKKVSQRRSLLEVINSLLVSISIDVFCVREVSQNIEIVFGLPTGVVNLLRALRRIRSVSSLSFHYVTLSFVLKRFGSSLPFYSHGWRYVPHFFNTLL